MAAAISTPMAVLTVKSFSKTPTKLPNSKPTKPMIPLLHRNPDPRLTSGAIAGAFFTTLAAAEPSFAAQQLAEIADADNRGVALLLPIVPAVAWVLFNILQPALNQINRMRSAKGLILGLGFGGLTAAMGLLHAPTATAAEAAAGSDNRGQLLLFVVAPAILWVLYNILQPALNQINRMRSE